MGETNSRSGLGVPTDLFAISLFVIAVGIMLFVVSPELRLLRAAVAFAFVLFVPGYAFLAILFPRHGTRLSEPESRVRGSNGLTGIERCLLSIPTSIAIVVLVGLFLGMTERGIRPTTLYLALALITGIELLVASIVQEQVRHEDRIETAMIEWIGRARDVACESNTRLELALNLWLVGLLILALPALGLAVGSQGDDGFTEAYLLTFESDTAFVAEEYPDTFIEQQTERLWLGLGNHEGTTTNYSIVVLVQRTEVADGAVSVVEEAELLRMDVVLDPGEEQRLEHSITPGEVMQGEDLRLVYLVYVDEPPASPSVDTAYRSLHLWIDVIEESELDETP